MLFKLNAIFDLAHGHSSQTNSSLFENRFAEALSVHTAQATKISTH